MTAPSLRGPPAPTDAPRRASRPLLVELTGLAGAGKTTLARAVLCRVRDARTGLRLPRARDLPAIAAAAGRVAPAFVRGLLDGSTSAAHDARYSLRLLAHRSAAMRALRSPCRLVVIDEGPVFMLARLLAFGSARSEGSRFGAHWQRSLEWWRGRLDAIVWLDAPDATLAARIRQRGKSHRVKDVPDDELRHFLARYRAAYSTVVARIADGGPRVIHIDCCEPVDLEVDRLLTALALPAVPRRAGDRT